LRFYEPHYKLWFFPLMPKVLGSWYLRLRGRDPVLLKQITYTTNWRVRKLLKFCGASRFLDLNSESVMAKCREGGSRSGGWKRRLVRQLALKPVLNKVVLKGIWFFIHLREGGSELLVLEGTQGG
jgi:hypothetical protein